MRYTMLIAAGSLGYFWGNYRPWAAVGHRAMLIDLDRDRRVVLVGALALIESQRKSKDLKADPKRDRGAFRIPLYNGAESITLDRAHFQRLFRLTSSPSIPIV